MDSCLPRPDSGSSPAVSVGAYPDCVGDSRAAMSLMPPVIAIYRCHRMSRSRRILIPDAAETNRGFAPPTPTAKPVAFAAETCSDLEVSARIGGHRHQPGQHRHDRQFGQAGPIEAVDERILAQVPVER